MAKYQETYKLPSNGKIYSNDIEEITIRSMTTADEKFLLGSSGEKAIDYILKACIVSPEDIDLDSLIPSDKHFILMKLRILSYGSDYNISYKCPECNNTNEFNINLDELDINTIPDNFELPLEITLPVSGDKLTLTIPSSKDLDEADKLARKHHKKFPLVKGDYSYIFRLMANIKEINDKELTSAELFKYVESIYAKDSAYIKHKLNSISIGYDTEVSKDCNFCGESLEFRLPMNAEFFHPRFYD